MITFFVIVCFVINQLIVAKYAQLNLWKLMYFNSLVY